MIALFILAKNDLVTRISCTLFDKISMKLERGFSWELRIPVELGKWFRWGIRWREERWWRGFRFISCSAVLLEHLANKLTLSSNNIEKYFSSHVFRNGDLEAAVGAPLIFEILDKINALSLKDEEEQKEFSGVLKLTIVQTENVSLDDSFCLRWDTEQGPIVDVLQLKISLRSTQKDREDEPDQEKFPTRQSPVFSDALSSAGEEKQLETKLNVEVSDSESESSIGITEGDHNPSEDKGNCATKVHAHS